MTLKLIGNTWHMHFEVKGIVVRESTHMSNRRDAERLEATRKAELVEQVVLGKLRPIKLHDAIDEYLKARKHLPSHKSASQRLAHYRTIPNIFLHTISNHQLQSIIENLFEQEYERSTIGGIVGRFNSLLKYCEDKGYSVRKRIDNIKGITGKLRWLTKEELQRFFDAIDPNQEYNGKSEQADAQRAENFDLVRVLYHTAARYHEVADMKWSQVDFVKGTVTVLRGKGSNNSTLFMTKLLKEILERRYAVKTDEYVFSSKQGRNYENSWVRRAVKRAKLDETTGSVSLHTLRHTMASHMVQAGLGIAEVQVMLGHKNIRSTMIYAHLATNATAEKIVQMIDALDGHTAPASPAKKFAAPKLAVVK